MSNNDLRLFAVIPAAGHSRRMGRPKLLLDVGGRTVIARLMDALAQAGVTQRFVVVRSDDAELQSAAEQAGGCVIVPEIDPPDMRTSVEHALAAIRDRCTPNPDDGWLLIPADHPLLESDILTQLIREWQRTAASILLPTHAGRRGHPAFFRWRLADEVPRIPPDQGLNWLVRQHAADLVQVPTEHAGVLTDLDHPEDYARLLKQFE